MPLYFIIPSQANSLHISPSLRPIVLLNAAKVLHKLGYSKKKIRKQLRHDIESRLPDDEVRLQLAFDEIDHLPTKYKD
jgi:hypothetical protein